MNNEKYNVEKNSFTRILVVISFAAATFIGLYGAFFEIKSVSSVQAYFAFITSLVLGYCARRGYQDSKEKKND